MSSLLGIVDGFDNLLARPSQRVKRANPDLMVGAPVAKKLMSDFFKAKELTLFQDSYQTQVVQRQAEGKATCLASWSEYLECSSTISEMLRVGTKRILGAKNVLAIKDKVPRYYMDKSAYTSIREHLVMLYNKTLSNLADHFCVPYVDVEECILFMAAEHKLPFEEVWEAANQEFYAPHQDDWKLSMYHTTLMDMVKGATKKSYCSQLIPYLKQTLNMDIPECRDWVYAVADRIHRSEPPQARHAEVKDYLDMTIRGVYDWCGRKEDVSKILFCAEWLVWN